MSALDIRPCRPADVARLEEWLPSGLSGVHAQRFGRQEAGSSTFLVAWSGDVPVASGEVRWDGFAAPEVRERFVDLPELNGLQVWPPAVQGRGLGTMLVRASEELALARGVRRLGMGVAEGNPRAAALYLRLGYEDVDCLYLDRYFYLSDDGVRHDVADPCRVLVHRLP